MKREKVLITGASGILGSNTALMLHKSGYKTRLLTHCSVPPYLSHMEAVVGDLCEIQSLSTAVKGCDFVVHCAGHTDVRPARSELHHLINFEGTKNLMKVCLEEELKRIAYIGSANSFALRKNDCANECSGWVDSKAYGMDYVATKLKATQYVLNLHRQHLLPVVLLCPTFMIGPYDHKPSSGTLLVEACSKKLPGFPEGGGRNFVDVRDVAQAILSVLQGRGRNGECYITGNQNMEYRELFDTIKRVTGRPQPTRAIPKELIKAYGFLGSLGGLIMGKQPRITVEMARISCLKFYFESSKAVRELGMPQTPIKIALKDAYQWFVENDYIQN